jgi:hypothetical protein
MEKHFHLGPGFPPRLPFRPSEIAPTLLFPHKCESLVPPLPFGLEQGLYGTDRFPGPIDAGVVLVLEAGFRSM